VTLARDMAELRWRCRRGMRELDLLVGGWLEANYAAASAEEQEAFRRLLETPDPQLFGWLMARDRPEDPMMAKLVNAIRDA